MNIDDMIAVLEAAKRGEPIEQHLKGSVIWESKAGDWWNFAGFDYRIAPKKEMTLVEEIRLADINGRRAEDLFRRCANRIKELEGRPFPPTIDQIDTDKLLAELKRRTSC
jgi:hypothetical protein